MAISRVERFLHYVHEIIQECENNIHGLNIRNSENLFIQHRLRAVANKVRMVLQNLSRLILRISGIRISDKIIVFFNCTKQLDFKDHNTVGITEFI